MLGETGVLSGDNTARYFGGLRGNDMAGDDGD